MLSCAFGAAEDLDTLRDAMSTANEDPLPTCKLFDPMLTNRGICHTFNAVSFQGMGKDNFYMKTFTEIFHPKEDDQIKKIPGIVLPNC